LKCLLVIHIVDVDITVDFVEDAFSGALGKSKLSPQIVLHQSVQCTAHLLFKSC
jgi:hypothetical protein